MKPTLLKVLEKHREAIALTGEPLGVTHCAEHHIKLKPGSSTVYLNAYKLPHSQTELVQEMIKDMLEQGVIQESNSPWNSPIFLVPKKDGTFLPVIGFRRVNEVTVVITILSHSSGTCCCLGKGNNFFFFFLV